MSAHQSGVNKIGRPPQTHVQNPKNQPQNKVTTRAARGNRGEVLDADFDSTCIDWGEWEDDTLTMQFVKGGPIYSFDCTRQQWRELLAGGSAGEYLNDEIL